MAKSSVQSTGGPNAASTPNQSFTISGIATSKPNDTTSFATVGAVRRCRKRNRSRTKPISGATTTTATTNAGMIGHPSFDLELVEDGGRRECLGRERQVEDP